MSRKTTWEDTFMDWDRFSQMSDSRLTRRSTFKLAGVIGAASVFATRGPYLASAQEAEDPFDFPDLSIIAVDYAF